MNSVNTTITSEVTQPDEVAVPVQESKPAETIIEEGKGIYVYDSDGKQYIEGLAGLWCTSLGYGNQEIVDAAAKQMSRLPYTHIFAGKSNDLAIEHTARYSLKKARTTATGTKTQ